ncbi:SusC/RagA family TonB-linked outer membrane protein [Marinifilum caeruleilacunae]|nr:TonB-dependent receptor [Marinifilum caeruleilacunae]
MTRVMSLLSFIILSTGIVSASTKTDKNGLNGNFQSDKQLITGVVKDATNEFPIPGVNVFIKGTTEGTITDIDGNYSISVNQGSILVFSFIGMKSEEIEISNQKVIDVMLEVDAIGLNEVVAIGYGTQKKSDITGSVASFNTDVLREQSQTNIVQALQGNMAGITVTTNNSSAEDDGTILIRGQNSITASNEPLIVLDGIPFDGSLSELNSNDIESMEVLKDASSTAIYGSRGSNGVILITTKKGKAGKMTVSYSGSYSWDFIGDLPDMQNASDYWSDIWQRNVSNVLASPSNTLSISKVIDNAFQGDASSNTDIAAFMEGYPGQTWDEVKNNILANYPDATSDWTVLQQIANAFAYPEGGRDTDWVDLASRVGHKQEHNLSISGGSEKNKYYMSAIYGKNEGVAKGDDFERFVYRLNLSFDLGHGITYGTNTQLGFYDRSGEPADWGTSRGAFRMSPTYNAYNADGTIDLTPTDEDSSVMNPLEPLLYENEDKETRIITNHFLDIDIPKVQGLHYKLNAGYQTKYREDKTYKGNNTVSGSIYNGYLEINDKTSKSWTIDNILSYNRDFGKHSIFLTALYSIQESIEETDGMIGKGFQSDVMGYYQPENAEILTGSATKWERSSLSQMFRANYVYDSRYLITATMRRDGASQFGDNKKFGWFPSVALGWNISNESFMSDVEAVDALKFRLSYGESGNEAVSAYETLRRMNSNDYIDENDGVQTGYYAETLDNPDLSWETTKSINAGLDFTLFGGRVFGAFDVFSSSTEDLLLSETISGVNGTTSILRNIGETSTKGFEIQISTVNISTKDFTWKTSLNASSFKSEIENVGLKNADGHYIDDVASEWFIGHPVNVNFDYSLDRILQKSDFITDGQGNYVLDANNNYQLKPEVADEIVLMSSTARPGQPIVKDVNGDGKIDGTADKEIQGDQNPDFTAGLKNTFIYKNWTFSFFLNGVWGVTKRNTLVNNDNFGPRRKLNATYWTPDNATTDLPGINMGGLTPGIELYPYEDASYVRLQDISLAYNFKSLVEKHKWISDFEVYANLKNVYTWTEWDGIDPEYYTGEDTGSKKSIEIPRPVSIIIGTRITF